MNVHLLFLAIVTRPVVEANPRIGNAIVDVKLLFPSPLYVIQIVSEKKGGQFPFDQVKELAHVATKKFKEYVNDVLPLELASDPEFAEEFLNSDHTRVNIGFTRWQMAVLASAAGSPVSEYAFRKLVPRMIPKVEYTWPELFKAKIHKPLHGAIWDYTQLALQDAGMPRTDIPPSAHIVGRVEVFNKGDFQRPMERLDGALAQGIFVVKAVKNAVKLRVEDPRGINPPYGKSYLQDCRTGQLILMPAWQSYMVTPNRDVKNRSVVFFSFVVYSRDQSSKIKTIPAHLDAFARIIGQANVEITPTGELRGERGRFGPHIQHDSTRHAGTTIQYG